MFLAFGPILSILDEQLGTSAGDLLVTLRPPANEAHYHNPESEVLFPETRRFLVGKPNVRVIVLPRNGGKRNNFAQE